ncbi:hypothetical protein MesoLjLb_67830 [Mesorhizobium sp. L-8-3]|nr:hypothetical protein MesoLjLb_67830 [Mesorhizobium sp. L-8-3]
MRDRKGSFAGDVHDVQDRYCHGIQRIALAMHGLEVPAIAAVDGAAIGAGFDLATMCDIRIAAHNAVFGSTFINLGIVPGDGGAWFLQDLVGPQRAADIIFTGRLVGAEESFYVQYFRASATTRGIISRRSRRSWLIAPAQFQGR